MSVQSYLQVLIPQYANEQNINTFIDIATLQTNECWFGNKYEYAIALRVAHMVTLQKTRPLGETGAISSKKEGDLSVNFVAGAGQGINDLDQTHFGKQLKSIIQQGRAFVGVTGGTDPLC